MQWRQPVHDFGRVASVPVDMQPCECLGPIPVWAQTCGRAAPEARPSFGRRKVCTRCGTSVGEQLSKRVGLDAGEVLRRDGGLFAFDRPARSMFGLLKSRIH